MSSSSSNPRNAKMISEPAFKAFRAISEFVADLSDAFGSKFREVTLYNHLLSKTKISNKEAVTKHIQIFGEFCVRNQDALLKKAPTQIVSRRITYSDKVFLDLYSILNQPELQLDTSTADAIWNHLLVIQATIDPTSKAHDILTSIRADTSNEGQFLGSFLNKIQGNINPEQMAANPMSAVTNILQSGVLNDLVGSIDQGVKGGTLDLGKLTGMVQQMLGGLNMGANPAESGPALGGLNLGSMMSMMMGGGLGSLGGLPTAGQSMPGLNADKVREQLEAKIEAEAKQLQLEESKTAPEPAKQISSKSELNELD